MKDEVWGVEGEEYGEGELSAVVSGDTSRDMKDGRDSVECLLHTQK
jgi:hypothetical protein